jgi:LmbE family N-acetylglucosaminyl deacetylase
MIFAAHPDDETLGCGGTIVRRLTEGYEVFVVVLTDGRNALSTVFGIKNSPTPEEMEQIRRTEIIRAMKILGVPSEHLRFLGIEDGTLLYHAREAAKKIDKILNEVRPQEIYFPHEKDNNPDHQAASLLVHDCINNLSFSTCAYKYSLGQRFSRLGWSITRLLDFFRNDLVFVDVSPFLNKKAAAIREYKSQITVINKGQKRPVVANSKRFLKKHELFHMVDKELE